MAQEIYHRSEWGNPTETWGNVYLNADLTNELYKRASEYENSWVTDQLLNGVGIKPSIILTPTAYEDGVLNSVKPAKTFGSELVTNGSFDTDSDWTKSNATISGGKATITIVGGAFAYINQSGISYTNGRVYNIKATLNGTSGKIARVLDAGGNNGGLTTLNQGLITLDGTDQNIDITWTANSNSAVVQFARDTSGDWSFTVDNVSVKEVIDADFDFTRGSSATRVNEQGLVEDVQILSGELVQNGDFEQIGSELITNGGFDSDSGWTKLNATISDGKGNLDGDGQTSLLYQNILTQDKFYKVTFTVSDYNELGTAIIMNNNGLSYYTITTNGTFTIYFKHTISNGNFLFRATNGAIYSIDNVSVKEVGQNWEFFGEAEFTDNGARIYSSDGSNSYIGQLSILTNTKKYRLSYEITDSTTGSLKLINVNGLSSIPITSTVGTHTLDFTANNNNFYILRNSGATDVTIDNISVVEITDDTDLPRINYKDGEGSLLLEPQRTNLITSSENLTSGNKSNVTATANTNETLDPSGNNNATKFEVTATGADANIRTQYTAALTDFSCFIYLKGEAGQKFELFVARDSFTEIKTGVPVLCTGDWQKVQLSDTFSTTSTTVVVGLEFGHSSTDSVDGQVYYLWGAQLEAGSYPTSYIPTNGSTVTRLADVCKNSGNSDLINSTEGVLYVEALLKDTGTFKTAVRITATDTSTTDGLWIYFRNDNKIQGVLRVGGTDQAGILSNVQATDEYYKVAFKYKQNDFALWVNGTEVGTDTNGNVFSADTLTKLGFVLNNTINPFIGNVKCVAVFKEALSDTELEKLTTI